MKKLKKQVSGYFILKKIKTLEYLVKNTPDGMYLAISLGASAPYGWDSPYYHVMGVCSESEFDKLSEKCKKSEHHFKAYSKEGLETELDRFKKRRDLETLLEKNKVRHNKYIHGIGITQTSVKKKVIKEIERLGFELTSKNNADYSYYISYYEGETEQ